MDINKRKKLEKTFSERVNAIYHNLCGEWDKDLHYFDNCIIYDDAYIICGRNHDYVKKFDHEPTDIEINNALVYRFNMSTRHLK